MTLAQVRSCAVVGLEGSIVEVEVDIAPGLPAFTIVGLPDTAVQEARERVRAAIRNSGFEFPQRRITVSLAPADLKKNGTSYDLPIAAGILIGSGQAGAQFSLDEVGFLGELSLEGQLRHTQGVLPMTALAREGGLTQIVVPAVDAPEAALVDGIEVLPAGNLRELVEHISGEQSFRPFYQTEPPADPGGTATIDGFDMSLVRGQENVKRALEVAAAGGHNLVMMGPPGSGKTLLARCLPSVLPTMTRDESLDVTKIYSVAGLLPPERPLISARPFRSPHYTVSNAGLVGGGHWPRPGEITLSHRGVLFLDEMPEFGHHILEVLRQPLEDKAVTISRAQGSITFPANFMLVGAMNPCPCGFYGDVVKACSCSPSTIDRYQRRISGPLLDRIDIFVDVPRVEYEKLTDDRIGETSAVVRSRVEEARTRQRARFGSSPGVLTNADMGPVEVREYCGLDDASHGLLRAAMQQLHLSARGFHRILKLARTIADLAEEPTITSRHLSEALQYRPRELGAAA